MVNLRKEVLQNRRWKRHRPNKRSIRKKRMYNNVLLVAEQVSARNVKGMDTEVPATPYHVRGVTER